MATLHHLGYKLPHVPRLHRTRFVLLCGSPSRAAQLASHFSHDSEDLCRTDRYTLYNPVPEVVVASHGIGTGSIDPLLHELYHLLQTAGARDYQFIRVGTCGGIGLQPGTMVITRTPLNGLLQPFQRLYLLGKQISLPTRLDESLSTQLFKYSSTVTHSVLADTLSADTFHLAQARCDAAFVLYRKDARDNFFRKCQQLDVRNIEMESSALAAFATKLRIPAAVLCVVLVDRLLQETPEEDADILKAYVDQAVDIVVKFVKDRIQS